MLALWIVSAVVVGVVASCRGRDGFLWLTLSLLLSPVVVVVLLLLPVPRVRT